MLALSALFELRFDDALEDVVAVATKLAKGEGSAVAAAAEIAAVSLRLRARDASRWRSGSPTWCSRIA